MARTLPALAVTLGGRPTDTQTTGAGTANAVVLTTAVPQLALTLTSVYLGAGAGQALAAHLTQAPQRDPELAVQRVDAIELPVSHARRRCLLDHATALQHAAGALADATVAIDVPDVALAAADELFEPLD